MRRLLACIAVVALLAWSVLGQPGPDFKAAGNEDFVEKKKPQGATLPGGLTDASADHPIPSQAEVLRRATKKLIKNLYGNRQNVWLRTDRSCGSNPNDINECFLHGFCVNARCVCDPGWMGPRCNQKSPLFTADQRSESFMAVRDKPSGKVPTSFKDLQRQEDEAMQKLVSKLRRQASQKKKKGGSQKRKKKKNSKKSKSTKTTKRTKGSHKGSGSIRNAFETLTQTKTSSDDEEDNNYSLTNAFDDEQKENAADEGNDQPTRRKKSEKKPSAEASSTEQEPKSTKNSGDSATSSSSGFNMGKLRSQVPKANAAPSLNPFVRIIVVTLLFCLASSLLFFV